MNNFFKHLSQRFLSLLCIIIATFGFTGCTETVCYDADDFGFSSVTVPAYCKTNSGDSSTKCHGTSKMQYVEWKDSGLTLDGSDIYMIVRNWSPSKNINSSAEVSAWCAWLGPVKTPPSLQSVCRLLDDCRFLNNDMCSSTTGRAEIVNAPCLLKKGIGLYFAAVPEGFDPNQNPEYIAQPYLFNSKVISYHMGQTDFSASDGTRTSFYDFVSTGGTSNNSLNTFKTGGYYKKLTSEESKNLKGGKLYFKILDSFYEDNSGQYIVLIKSGVTNTSWDPGGTIITLIKNFYFGVPDNSSVVSTANQGIVRVMFRGVVENTEYQLFVSALLTLAITYYAFQYVIGSVQITTSELFWKSLKIVTVCLLLKSGEAWEFLGTHVFDLFIGGAQSLNNMILGTSGSTGGEHGLFSIIFSPQLYIKLLALPNFSSNSFGIGLLYIILFIVAILMVIYALIYVSMVLILCLLMLGIMIIVAPIFFCFLLFDATREFFDQWARNLLSYALQPIVVLGGVGLMGMMVKDQVYKNLGYRVCQHILYGPTKQNAFNTGISGSSGRTPSIYYWEPKYNDSREGQVEMLVPNSHYVQTSTSDTSDAIEDTSTTYCGAYECVESRYPSFPYLDPNNSSDMRRLERFWNHEPPNPEDAFLLILCCLVMIMFIENGVKVAAHITSGESSVANSIGGLNAKIHQDFKRFRSFVGSTAGAVGGAAIKYGLGIKKLNLNLGSKRGKLNTNVTDAVKNIKDKDLVFGGTSKKNNSDSSSNTNNNSTSNNSKKDQDN
ncbi:MAG: type IV secretion system protein [Rickettsiaceae bacterium]|nr:type IV secretion system protein [Rickettsiaceae bacterium]